MSWATKWLILVLAVGGVSSCREEEKTGIAGEWIAEREAHGDTILVRTLSGSIWQDSMQLIPEFRVGALGEDEELIFGEIEALDLDSTGRIFLLEGQTREVRVLSADGDHIRSFGRFGDGPGEFNRPVHLGVASDGRVVVRDEFAGRFSVFSPDGEFLNSWSRGSGYTSLLPFYFDSSSQVLSPSVAGSLVRYDLDGSAIDTTDVKSLAVPVPQIEIAFNEGGVSLPMPYAPSGHWAVTQGGNLVQGFSRDYRFELSGADGTVLRVERALDGVPVLQGEAEQIRTEVTRAIVRAFNRPEWSWAGEEIPPTKPAFDRIFTGRDGTIWLFRSMVSREEENPSWDPEQPEVGFPTRWVSSVIADVFDENGRYLGPVRIPDELEWQQAAPVLTADEVWSVARTDEGILQIVRFSVEPISER